jgi:polysaccharide deacetylase family protein (PEP-CTERM system associated)
VREIADRGHEVASHGYGHRLVSQVGPDRFREDVRRSRGILEDLSGRPVRGYRAPSYSITRECRWAAEILVEEGFGYDSSLFPIRHDLGGLLDSPRFPFVLQCRAGSIVEFPFSTVRLGGHILPVAGGGYFRLLPAWLTALGIRRINEAEGEPAAVYFHPWELDPDQPRVACPLRSRFRHYQNLRTTRRKLDGILGRFAFAPMGEVIDRISGSLRTVPAERIFGEGNPVG